MAKLEQRRYKICTAIFPGIEGSCLRTIAPSLMGGADYTFRPVLFYMEVG